MSVTARDAHVSNRAFCVALGVTVDGHRDVLGVLPGDGGGGAKCRLAVLTEMKNRGVAERESGFVMGLGAS